jgi:hypothetical protein
MQQGGGKAGDGRPCLLQSLPTWCIRRWVGWGGEGKDREGVECVLGEGGGGWAGSKGQ